MAEQSASPSANTSFGDLGLMSPVPSEILKGVVAYVEVRTANDNRSTAVKRVLERMGAKVDDKFSDDVTHVIFKEGKKRTVDKAKKLGVHLVSVLWVDSCKQKQQRVPEHQFSANTERCGTPPPGVRWKKYKSMQPQDFEDEVVRSAERCQKRRRRKDTYKHLLQGGEATPFHSPAHVLVVDTQPRSPLFPSLGLQTPVVIPNTPPSMQARLKQLIRKKEARRRESEGSSLYSSDNLDLAPLQRTLFKNPSSPEENLIAEEKLANGVSVPRRSNRLSGCAGSESLSSELSEIQRGSHSTDSTKVHSGSEAGSEPAVVSQAQSSSSSSESGSVTVGEKEKHTKENNPNSSMSPQIQPKTQVRRKIKATQHSLPCTLSQTAQAQSSSSSQLNKPLSKTVQQTSDTTQASSTAHARSSVGRNRHKRTHSQGPQSDGCENDNTNHTEQISEETGSSGSRKNPSKNPSRTHTDRKAETGCDGERNTADSASQEKPNQTENIKTAGINVASWKPVSRKRKLLNPSQELHVLSPFPTDNLSLPVPVADSGIQEKRGQKRKSCDVDAVFPSSLPTSKRGCGSTQMKENELKRMSSTQVDLTRSGQSSKSSSKGRRKTAVNRRMTQHKTQNDESVSTLYCTSQTSSILGSSMSVVFNNSSRPSLNKFAPPRNSLAEFKVKKTQRQSKQGPLIQGSNSLEWNKDQKAVNLQKVRSTGMPSLVMTSLHRQEQDCVVSAVKRLGVFRIEDKVSKHTTHVVCGEPRRTLNILHGLARGCWIVSKKWVTQSVENGHWLDEEDYEMVEGIPMSKTARLAREAEEPEAYSCRIFEAVGSFFVSNTCTPPRTELIKLLQLCGAKVTDSIQRADFYIGDNTHDDKNSIKPIWVLDCISQQELLPMDDYILAINYRTKPSSSPEF